MSHPDFEELRAEFGEVMDILNEGPLEDLAEQPGQDVWEGIAASLRPAVPSDGSMPSDGTAGVDSSAAPGSDSEAPTPRMDHINGTTQITGTAQNTGTDSADAGLDDGAARPLLAPRASFSHRDSSIGKRFAIMTAVAAAILLIAVPLALAFGGDSVDRRADLVAFGPSGGAGTAELTDNGSLQVRLSGLEPLEGAVYELWLLDLEGDELQDLRSLGNIDEDGTFTVPEDLDLSEFSVVDVSIEPEDGNVAHSGNSVLRGALEKP